MQFDLFLEAQEGACGSKKRAAKDEVWALVDHACSFCGGRILRRTVGADVQFRCSECGETGHGRVESLCCCGVMTSAPRKRRDRNDHDPEPDTPFVPRRLLQCMRNHDRKPGNMAEIVIQEYKESPSDRACRDDKLNRSVFE